MTSVWKPQEVFCQNDEMSAKYESAETLFFLNEIIKIGAFYIDFYCDIEKKIFCLFFIFTKSDNFFYKYEMDWYWRNMQFCFIKISYKNIKQNNVKQIINYFIFIKFYLLVLLQRSYASENFKGLNTRIFVK